MSISSWTTFAIYKIIVQVAGYARQVALPGLYLRPVDEWRYFSDSSFNPGKESMRSAA